MNLFRRLQRKFKTWRDAQQLAWRKNVTRKKILETAPITDLTDDRCEIHILISDSHVLDLLWTLKSFYLTSKRKYLLCIHDDGKLSEEMAGLLLKHFPDARLIWRKDADADQALLNKLAPYPQLQRFRKERYFGIRTTDYLHYLRTSKILLLDADILFFREPAELLRRIEDPNYAQNTCNEDSPWDGHDVVKKNIVDQYCQLDFNPCFNAGLFLANRASLHHAWFEEFLNLPGMFDENTPKRSWGMVEQQLFAIASCRHGLELLPKQDYLVSLDRQDHNPCSRHYVSWVRNFMYLDGIPKLLRSGVIR